MLVSQACATLHAATMDHISAVSGAHADAEAMGFVLLPVVGLVSSFHRKESIPKSVRASYLVIGDRESGIGNLAA